MTRELTPEKVAAMAKKSGMGKKQLEDLIDRVKNPSAWGAHQLGKEEPPLDLSDLVEKNHVKIGIIGDTQLNSIGCRLDYLDALYKLFRDEGVKAVLHPGDFTDGINKYVGHANHLIDKRGWSFVVDYIAGVYPSVGIPTYFLTGNDDLTYYTKVLPIDRVHIGVKIADKRTDLHYLGMHQRRIVFKNARVQLVHPLDLNRGAYTISYPLQNLVYAFRGGWKPNILFVGGYHALFYMKLREIHSFLSGSTCDPTPYDIAKKRKSSCSAQIFTISLTDEGDFLNWRRSVIPFYK